MVYVDQVLFFLGVIGSAIGMLWNLDYVEEPGLRRGAFFASAVMFVVYAVALAVSL